MGYAWNGVCHQDSASALAAFVEDVPSAGNAVTTFAGVPSISSGGLVSWSIISQPLTGSDPVTVSSTTQLPACASESLAQLPVQSILVYLAMLFAAFVGFRTGFRV